MQAQEIDCYDWIGCPGACERCHAFFWPHTNDPFNQACPLCAYVGCLYETRDDIPCPVCGGSGISPFAVPQLPQRAASLEPRP